MREVSLKFLIYYKSKYFPQAGMKEKTWYWLVMPFILPKIRMYEKELLNTRVFLSVTSAKATIYPAKNRPLCHLSR
jgi:hypothetical protein